MSTFQPCTSYHHREELIKLKLYTKYIFMGYDEGIQENDMVLAAAVWRRFFGFSCEDFTLVERLVKYIRAQVSIILMRNSWFSLFTSYQSQMFENSVQYQRDGRVRFPAKIHLVFTTARVLLTVNAFAHDQVPRSHIFSAAVIPSSVRSYANEEYCLSADANNETREAEIV